jgi:glutaredoxin
MPTATIYRMQTPTFTCPSGLKARDILRRKGFNVDDRPLLTREATDAFKVEHDVKTTPQVFIDGKRIGGYDDTRAHFGMAHARPTTPTYRPVLMLFGMALLMTVALAWATLATPWHAGSLMQFLIIAMCLLALQKLRDVEAFTGTFLTYDLLAQRWVPYAYLYPFLEGGAGLLMLAGVLTWISAPVSIISGAIGVVSIIKAVYIEKRELKCACVGGNSNVPLGMISLIESVAMVVMGIWMLLMPPMAGMPGM